MLWFYSKGSKEEGEKISYLHILLIISELTDLYNQQLLVIRYKIFDNNFTQT